MGTNLIMKYLKSKGRPSLVKIEIANIDAAEPNGVKPPPKAPAKSNINQRKLGLFRADGSSLISATIGI